MGNIWGVAAGAFVVYMLQAIGLRQLNTVKEALHLPALDLGPLHLDLAKINFLDYQFLLFGVALVLMMLLRPEGLFPSQRRRRELHIAEELIEQVEEVEASPVVEELPAHEGAMGATPGSDEDTGSAELRQ
jgi:branched-chain amino acid transport system permease protein